MEDNSTTIENLKQLVNTFSTERDWQKYHTPKNLSMALAVEAAELMELFLWCEYSESFNIVKEKQEAVADEVVDVLWAVLSFALATKIDLTKELKRKMIKTAKRYPIEKCKGKSTKYTEL